MASTTTQTTVINRGLQILGYQPVASIQENSRGARAMNRAYEPVLMRVLRENFWGFAIKRLKLAASATAPAFGRARYYPLPGDFLRLAPQDSNLMSNQLDWQIETDANGTLCIASDDASPISVRYVSSSVNIAQADASFCEAFAAALAVETCEELTQSNTKLAAIAQLYKEAIDGARKTNAFEMRPFVAPTDGWITSRS